MKTVTRLLATVLAVLFLVSCEGESIKPAYNYRAPFDPVMVDDVEEFMKGLADRWELRLFEKSWKDSKILSDAKDEFFNALFFKDESILSITNAGVGTILTLYLFEHEDMSLSELQRLDEEVRAGLKGKFGIELLPY